MTLTVYLITRTPAEVVGTVLTLNHLATARVGARHRCCSRR